MTGKGHCKFDISGSDSEFSEFYDFSELQEGADSDVEANGEERNQQSSRKPLLADESSIRLPSGRVILRKSSVQAELSFSQLHRRNRTLTSRLEESSIEPDDEAGSSKDKLKSDKDDTRLISKREKREKAMVTYKLANMSANDRKGLIHLPAAQQRSILATQHRHMEKLQKEERRNQSHIERKGNKNLYAYWATETPVYQCG